MLDALMTSTNAIDAAVHSEATTILGSVHSQQAVLQQVDLSVSSIIHSVLPQMQTESREAAATTSTHMEDISDQLRALTAVTREGNVPPAVLAIRSSMDSQAAVLDSIRFTLAEVLTT